MIFKNENMKSFIALFLCLITGVLSAAGQQVIQHAPPGFDTLRSDIPHGTIDTISYFQKLLETSEGP
jgi:hypothetical protein